MSRAFINRLSAGAAITMSSLAVGVVIFVVATGWERNLKDEGAAAHIFQLLIAVQIPLIVTFLVTANWTRAKETSAWLAAQVGAIALAMGLVRLFHL